MIFPQEMKVENCTKDGNSYGLNMDGWTDFFGNSEFEKCVFGTKCGLNGLKGYYCGLNVDYFTNKIYAGLPLWTIYGWTNLVHIYIIWIYQKYNYNTLSSGLMDFLWTKTPFFKINFPENLWMDGLIQSIGGFSGT